MNVGIIGQVVEVMVLDITVLLLHPSVAVHVLVCMRSHPFDDIAPSTNVGVSAPQLSVAVADPSAALIAAADGLHAAGNGVCVTLIVGAIRSCVQVTVRVAVTVLPQASVAVNVLVCN